MSKSVPSYLPLAVVGMACRLPGAKDLDEYWQLIRSAGDATGELPPEVFDRELYYDPRRGVRGKSYSAVGGLVPRLPFDNKHCRLPEEMIANYDEAHLAMCEVTSDALRDAKYDPFDLPTRNVGVYFGHAGGSTKAGDVIYSVYIEQTAQYLHKLNSLQHLSRAERERIARNIVEEVRGRCDHRVGTPGIDLAANTAAQLIAMAFGLDGPCIVVDAACASSLQAMMLGVRALQQGAIEMAIVGGASCCKSDSLILFSQAQSVSAGKSCPFDAEASGLVTAEGYVTLVLKTLPEALADGDSIRCVIQGIGMSADGKGKSLWAPRKEGQVIAIKRAYPESLRPEDVQYIEAHATSTQVGDATELAALAEVFTEKLPSGRKIALGSVKGNIGHTLETAGIASLVKTILAIEHGVIPPVVNLTGPNPAVDWETIPFYLPTKAEPWTRPRDGQTRKAAVNAFGIGGLNVHVVLEEYLAEQPASHYLPPQREAAVGMSAADEPIAVVGMGAILPGAKTAEEFWRVLHSGEDPKTDVTPDRWDPVLCYEPGEAKPYRSRNKRGGFVTDYHYDWRRHRVPPKQIANANPLQFMLLDAAEQALIQSGYAEKGFDRDRVGVIVGTIFGGEFSNQLQAGLRLPEFGRSLRRLLAATGMPTDRIEQAVAEYETVLLSKMPALLDETGSFTSSTLASRITKTFDLKGGALSMDAGLGSGLAAIGACMDVLRSGACDMMICAAGQRNMDITTFESLGRLGGLAPGEPHPAYDARSDGYVPGEGCGVLLMKRLCDAQRDGDRVLAVVRGVAASAEFKERGAAIQRALRRALKAARISPAELRAVETIGALPTLEEVEIARLSAEMASASRRAALVVSSLVPQFGFMGAAHSMAAAIKACLAGSRGSLPAGIGTERPRAGLFPSGAVQPQREATPVVPSECSAIGISCGVEFGTAYHAIVEPVEKTLSRREARPGLVPASARSQCGHRVVRIGAGNWQALRHKLSTLSVSDAYQPDGAFGAGDRVRLAIVCAGSGDFEASYREAAEKLTDPRTEARGRLAAQGIYFGVLQPGANRCVFVFPGQGSQYAGMLSRLIEEMPEARAACGRADAAMRALGYEPFEAIAGKDARDLGADLWKTQVAMLLADSILDGSLRSLGLCPSLVAGHSFGEYAALVSAGAWSLTDAIRSTRHRYQAVAEARGVSGCMAATDTPRSIVERIVASIGDGVYLANVNAPDQTVIAGRRTAVENAVARLKQNGSTAVIIKVPCAFHTPFMREPAQRLAARLAEIPLRCSEIPVISTASSRKMMRPEDFVKSLVDQLVCPVNYPEILGEILSWRPALVVEVGPQQVLTRLNRKNHAAGDVVFLPSDNPRRPGAAALLGVLAQAECLGCATNEADRGKHRSAAAAPSRDRIPVFDATQRHREKMRQKSQAAKGKRVRAGNGGGPPRQPLALAAPAVSAAEPAGSFGGTGREAPERDSYLVSGAGVRAARVEEESAPAPARAGVARAPARPGARTAETPAIDVAELREILVEFVVEHTGYPEDIVEMDADLEADLGIDSIKKAQLFGEVGERFQIAPREDLSLDDFPTLGHVLAFLEEELGGRGKSRAVPPAPARAAAVEVAEDEAEVPADEEVAATFAEAGQVPDAEQLQQILVEFVVEHTGYPEDIVEMDADLEADLGIDSIKKAQLFGEVGERFQIAPREDLSLDDFPTLGHVLAFLQEELRGRDGGRRPTETVSSPGAGEAAEAAWDLPDPDEDFVRVEVLEGSSYHMGARHGEVVRGAIHRELAGLVDCRTPGIGGSAVEWPEPWSEELRGLAAGGNLNREAVCAWNLRLEPLSSWRTVFGTASREPQFPMDNESLTFVQVRKPARGLAYLTVGKPGQLVVRAGVNAARVAVSCEPLGAGVPGADVVAITQALHGSLATCASAAAVQSRLRGVPVRDDWCIGISTPSRPSGTYLVLSNGGLRRDAWAGPSDEQRAFHQSLQQDPAVLVLTDRRTGASRRIPLDEFLPPDSLPAESLSSAEPDDSPAQTMRRHVLRMTPAPIGGTARAAYRVGDLVCLIGDSPVGTALRTHLECQGCRVEAMRGPGWLAVFQRLLEDGPPQHLVLLDESSGRSPSLDAFCASERYFEPFEACRSWIEALEREGSTSKGSLVAATRMGGDFGFGSSCGGYAGAGLCGLLKGIRREYPALRVKVLDFDETSGQTEIARAVFKELASDDPELEIGFRGRERYVVQAVAEPAPAKAARRIPQGGVWVVTGGGRGVTSVVARELGHRYGLRLHLIGTTPLPGPDAAWRGLTEAELKELKKLMALRARRDGKSPADVWRRVESAMELDDNLRRLAEEGVEAAYHVCDITDRRSLETTLRQIRQRDGAIQGVIHGAGIEAACKFVRKRPDPVRATISSKCDGAANLVALTRQDPLQYFVAFGSTSGRFGGLGQADYSLASDLLAKMIGRLAVERPDCVSVCFHWPAWDEVGMAVRPESKLALERGGMAFMSPREGVTHLINELEGGAGEREILILDKPGFLDTDGTMTRGSLPADPEVFRAPLPASSASQAPDAPRAAERRRRVGPSDGSTAGESMVDCSAMPLIETIRRGSQPGSYEATVLLDPLDDPFLAHHRFKGMPFLPGVISLESFAEAAALLRPQATVVGFSQARLQNGLPLGQSRKYEARIRIAEVPEGVRCELVGAFINSRGNTIERERTYASAVVELGEGPPEIAPVDPGKPVFGWTPFSYPREAIIQHGPPFRSFKTLDFQHGGGRAQILGIPARELVGNRRKGDLVIACSSLDGCMVACGMFGYCMLERCIEIPLGMSRYRQVRVTADGERCVARFYYRGTNQEGNVYDIVLLGEPGDVVFEVKGYQTAKVQETS